MLRVTLFVAAIALLLSASAVDVCGQQFGRVGQFGDLSRLEIRETDSFSADAIRSALTHDPPCATGRSSVRFA
jgi:hypothetical protein